MNLLTVIGNAIFGLLNAFRWVIVAVLAIGLPVVIYVTFIADEPVFPAENDIELGGQTVASISADPEQFPILPETDYPEAYKQLRSLVARLVQSPEIRYGDLFAYDQVKIIHDDSVLNAFCAPGGYIYVYTGLMRYLETEDHLAGVLGHEIAHAELRHSSIRLQKEYGAERLLDFALISNTGGVGSAMKAVILKDLLSLDYSRDQEAEADDYSVRYLSTSGYACDGTAGFFEKLLAEGQDVNIPEFLSDHPASDARVEAIKKTAAELECSTQLTDPASWRAVQATLPPLSETTERQE